MVEKGKVPGEPRWGLGAGAVRRTGVPHDWWGAAPELRAGAKCREAAGDGSSPAIPGCRSTFQAGSRRLWVRGQSPSSGSGLPVVGGSGSETDGCERAHLPEGTRLLRTENHHRRTRTHAAERHPPSGRDPGAASGRDGPGCGRAGAGGRGVLGHWRARRCDRLEDWAPHLRGDVLLLACFG